MSRTAIALFASLLFTISLRAQTPNVPDLPALAKIKTVALVIRATTSISCGDGSEGTCVRQDPNIVDKVTSIANSTDLWDVETTVQQGVETTDGEPPNKPTEIATSNPLRHEETCEAPEDDVSTSTPAAQSVQDAEEQGVTNTGGEPTSKPAGTNANDSPAPENCVTDAGVQMSNKTHEQAMEKEHGQNYETEPIGSSRFIETKEDEEFVE